MIRDRVKGSKRCCGLLRWLYFYHRQEHRNTEQSEMCEMFAVIRLRGSVNSVLDIIFHSMRVSSDLSDWHTNVIVLRVSLRRTFHFVHVNFFAIKKEKENHSVLSNLRIYCPCSRPFLSVSDVSRSIIFFPFTSLPPSRKKHHAAPPLTDYRLNLKFSRRVGRGRGIQNERYSVYVDHIRIIRWSFSLTLLPAQQDCLEETGRPWTRDFRPREILLRHFVPLPLISPRRVRAGASRAAAFLAIRRRHGFQFSGKGQGGWEGEDTLCAQDRKMRRCVGRLHACEDEFLQIHAETRRCFIKDTKTLPLNAFDIFWV